MGVTYLVTGANRGIGLSLVKLLSADEENSIIATTRSFSRAQELRDLGRDNVEIIELDVTHSVREQKESLEKLKFLQESGVDVFIQNAGIFIVDDTPFSEEPIENFVTHFEGNTLASIKFYQAVYPYWARKNPDVVKKAIFMTSFVGTIGNLQLLTKGYGLSKAGINFIAKHIAVENAESKDPTLRDSISISVHPGIVDTDMGKVAVKRFEVAKPYEISPDESADAMIKLFNEIQQEQSGAFLSYDGSVLEY